MLLCVATLDRNQVTANASILLHLPMLAIRMMQVNYRILSDQPQTTSEVDPTFVSVLDIFINLSDPFDQHLGAEMLATE